MANSRISQLPEIDTPGNDDVFVLDNLNTTTRKITFSNLKQKIIYALETMVGALSTLINRINGNPEVWDSDKNYVKGEKCLHDSKVWYCKAPNTNVIPTEGTYWTCINISTLKDDISGLNEDIGNLSSTTQGLGSRVTIAESDISSLKSRTTTTENGITTLNSGLASANTTINALKNQRVKVNQYTVNITSVNTIANNVIQVIIPVPQALSGYRHIAMLHCNATKSGTGANAHLNWCTVITPTNISGNAYIYVGSFSSHAIDTINVFYLDEIIY